MARVKPDGQSASTPKEHPRRIAHWWDRRFRSLPLVWAEAIRGDDGIVAGFVTCNGEIWRAEVLRFDGRSYSERVVGYWRGRAAAARAVLDPPPCLHVDHEDHETFHVLRGQDRT